MADSAVADISWPELIVLMGFGEDGGALRGSFRVRDVYELSDEYVGAPEAPEDLDAGLYDYVEVHPTHGRLAVTENAGALLVRGPSFRIEGDDGRPRFIETPDDRWFYSDAGMVHQDPRSFFMSAVGLPDPLIRRPPLSRWEGDDFTRPGPVAAVEFLGRPAWAFELMPPPHKPSPLQLVVDAATGRLLSYRNDDFGIVTEWTAVEFGVDLPDETFGWDGVAIEHDAPDFEVVEQQRHEWLAHRGITGLTLPAHSNLVLHGRDDATGSFEASFHMGGHGYLARRPASDEAWPVDERWFDHHVRQWRDGPWDWYLATTDPLTDVQLDEVKAQLRD